MGVRNTVILETVVSSPNDLNICKAAEYRQCSLPGRNQH